MQFTHVSVILFVLHVVCFIVLVSCLLNLFVICLGVVAVLLLNVRVVFCVWVGLLFSRPCIVFHSVCLFCLWFHSLFRCSLQMSVFCCMSGVISKFIHENLELCLNLVSVEFDIWSDVFNAFWNVVFVCFQNDIGECCICSG